ncbi:IS3 family transposase [Arthrobacter sp. ISL-72]|uniref:IS3 family transposase n=1 Tax=Arthrobacter sp. ISL-72 TaxID=2819114 RepID=UPI001BE955DD|nr:integrase core domain-containing protein [Arthrobacter sp. ISL-72]
MRGRTPPAAAGRKRWSGPRRTRTPTRGLLGLSVAESAFSSLKNEFYQHHSFATRQDARRATMRYIEVFYNRWRPHTNNDGLPPATAMAKFTTNQQPLHAAA